MIYLIEVALGGFLLSSLATAGMILWARKKGVVDIPNGRSSHAMPTPIGGGIAIMGLTIGLWIAYLTWARLLDPLFLVFAGAGLLLGIVSWVDDVRFVKAIVRFLVQALAAAAAMLAFGYYEDMALPFFGVVHLSWFGAPITFLWIIGLINAYNFVDGIDTMAGGQAVVAGLGWLILCALLNHPEIGVLGLVIASTSQGFLLYNIPPAKIFMGDVGSCFLGYSFAVIPLMLRDANPAIPFAAGLLFWPYVFDTFSAVLILLMKGANPLAPHRSFLFHRLHLAGFPRLGVSLLYHSLAIVGVGLAWVWMSYPNLWDYVGGAAGMLCLGLWAFAIRTEKHQKRCDEVPTTDVKAFVKGARVMVTGASGPIGEEICRQILTFGPSQLVLVGYGENSLLNIAAKLGRALERKKASVQIHTAGADIRDGNQMDLVFKMHHPEIIFHAGEPENAGLKQVNVPDAIRENIVGTQVLVDLAGKHGVRRFVLISCTKAVNPVSITGVTKRISELVVQDAAQRTGRAFVIVRFRNFPGNWTSMSRIFKKHSVGDEPSRAVNSRPDRSFMTIPESVYLMLKATTLGRGGEVFVLDLGRPKRLLDLVRNLIPAKEAKNEKDVDIDITSARWDEMQHEKLFYEYEKPIPTGYERILMHRNDATDSQRSDGAWTVQDRTIRYQVERLVAAAEMEDLKEMGMVMKAIVPEYGMMEAPGATGVEMDGMNATSAVSIKRPRRSVG